MPVRLTQLYPPPKRQHTGPIPGLRAEVGQTYTIVGMSENDMFYDSWARDHDHFGIVTVLLIEGPGGCVRIGCQRYGATHLIADGLVLEPV